MMIFKMKMKKQLLAVAVCGLMMAGGAMAADATTGGNGMLDNLPSTGSSTQGTGGVVHFKGKITDVSCDITSDSKDQTVDLGTWAKSYFTSAKIETTQMPFSINVENCPSSVTHVAVMFSGERDATDTTLLKITDGTATGVGIKLYEDDRSTQIALGTPTKGVDLTTADDATGTAKLDFYADYKANGAAVAVGDANADSTFTMVYN